MSQRPIRVVVVEDSPTMRAILHTRLSREGDIEVVASAANAAEGRQMIRELDPDVVTLDVEMPGMNGLDFLEKIMKLRPTPVIIVSGATQQGNETTARALTLGAVECYAKSQISGTLPLDDGGKLARLVRDAAKVRFANDAAPAAPITAAPPPPPPADRKGPPKVIVIGSSTGGVEALHTLLSEFPADCPPTLVVQHINERFTAAVARTLDETCAANVVLAQPDLPLRPGHIYFPPDNDRHLLIGGPQILRTKLRGGDRISGHRPSVDALFQSAADVVGKDAIGILLTGMGADGAKGLLSMARAGALTIAQDEATCAVFGMPRAAIALGAASIVAPIDQIARHTFSKVA
ncbi:chemotaxis-specific protein-glutamate methyltransferase CheB [Novosphingobium sp. LASN5T]|uniref:chemotaxis-specific protein-glutamate methyltransferase CheB n=1 Tax=Novosphingobium sp. LASN5T TaxID=2491021 RepID=UPI000F5F9A08|nr:chemotaxis-specific protein-glutamate methyltransferase CheB [Novosphingobium sp. LASN5T]RQW43972.1 chemotaxis-specific protein-glutamate methyltransferase CheB [Novosphingobium sp. LASN5T]